MRLLKFVFIAICLITLGNCGPSDSDGNYFPKSSPSYCLPGRDDNNNPCSTGIHRFSTFPELCAAVQNDSLNLNCAENERRDFFKDNCDGTYKRDTTIVTPPPYEGCSVVVINRVTKPAQ